MKRLFNSWAVGVIAAMGRPAATAAVVPTPQVEQATQLSEGEDHAALLNRAMLASAFSGDGVAAELQKLRERDRGMAVFAPVWVDITAAERQAATASFSQWMRESDARVTREILGRP